MTKDRPDGDDAEGGRPGPARPHYVLRLYVSGTTARSGHAIASLKKICETQLKDHYDLEVVDVYQNPQATKDDQIVAVPTLVKLLPEPLRRLIGDLSDRERVLSGLDIVPKPEPTR
jgi:circadian clock protein KaiB